jgi:hypothetical protein
LDQSNIMNTEEKQARKSTSAVSCGIAGGENSRV